MSIRVKTSPLFYQYTSDRGVVEVNGDTVGHCLNHLVKQFPGIEKALFDKDGKLLDYVALYVNGEDCYPEGLAKPVKDGDELHITPIIVGG